MTIKFYPFGGLYPAGSTALNSAVIADVALDVDLEGGSVKPWRSTQQLQAALGARSLYEIQGCCILTDPSPCTSWAEGNPSTTCSETVYRTSPGLPPQAATHAGACAGDWRALSFPMFPKLSVVAALVPSNETMEFLYAFYTVTDDWGRESAPSMLSDSFYTAFGSSMLFSGFPTAYPNGKSIKIYISRAAWVSGNELGGTEEHSGYYLAQEFPIGPASSTVTLDFPGEMNITWDYEPAPDDLWDISSFRGGQLLGISQNTLRASIKNTFHAWPRKFSVRFYGQARRLIAGRSYAYVLTDEAPMSFRVPAGCSDNSCFQSKQVNKALPIANPRSAAMYGETVVYATAEGLVALTGEEWKMFPHWTTADWQAMRPDTMIGAVYEEAYFFSCFSGTYRLDLRAPAERALTKISTNPLAMHTTTHGRLLMVEGANIVSWDKGGSYLTAKWERHRAALGPIRGASAIDVVGSGAHSITPIADGMALSTITNSGSYQDRFCPSRARSFGIKISTQGRVEQVIIAGSIHQLNQL